MSSCSRAEYLIAATRELTILEVNKITNNKLVPHHYDICVVIIDATKQSTSNIQTDIE